jgi:hypothetical protein
MSRITYGLHRTSVTIAVSRTAPEKANLTTEEKKIASRRIEESTAAE